MGKTFTSAQVRKGMADVAKLVNDPRLSTAVVSVAGDAKRFAMAQKNPKALLAKHGLKLPPGLATRVRLFRELSKPGRKFTVCIHTEYYVGSGNTVLDENGKNYKVEGTIEDTKCTTFVLGR
jgi:hypothetical protein